MLRSSTGTSSARAWATTTGTATRGRAPGCASGDLPEQPVKRTAAKKASGKEVDLRAFILVVRFGWSSDGLAGLVFDPETRQRTHAKIAGGSGGNGFRKSNAR